MKLLILIATIFCSIFVCSGQGSLDSISRTRADIVLESIKPSLHPTILYSIDNKYYYLIVSDDSKFQELYVEVDSAGKINKKHLTTNSKQNKIFFERAFELKNYHQSYVTTISNPTAYQGSISYFVLVTKDKKRYGEFCIPVIASPIPIDPELYTYLVSSIAKYSLGN